MTCGRGCRGMRGRSTRFHHMIAPVTNIAAGASPNMRPNRLGRLVAEPGAADKESRCR